MQCKGAKVQRWKSGKEDEMVSGARCQVTGGEGNTQEVVGSGGGVDRGRELGVLEL